MAEKKVTATAGKDTWSPEAQIERLTAEIQKFPKVENPVQNQQLYLSGLTYTLFDKAKEEAEALKDSFVVGFKKLALKSQ